MIARTPLKPPRGAVVLDAVDDLAEVVEAHGRPIPVGDDHGRVLGGPEELAVGLDREGLAVALEVAAREVDVVALDGAGDLVDAELPVGEGLGVELGADGVFLGAEDLDLGDAADHGDALCNHGFGVLVDVGQGEDGRTQGEVENGLVGRVDLPEGGGGRHVLGQVARGQGDGGLDVLGGGVEVPAEVELEGDLGHAEGAGRVHGIRGRRWWRTGARGGWRRRRPWSRGLRRVGWRTR